MESKTVRILQIGDVHFPDGKDSALVADQKDDGVKVDFVSQFANNGFRSSMRKMLSTLSEGEIDFVAFMGDLTSKGSLQGYNDCLEFFAKGLRMSEAPLIDTDSILVVAGNHDVCRKTALERPGEKFSVLGDMLESKGFRRIKDTAIDHRKILSGGCEIHVFGVNSCIGCGEKRFLPARVRDVIFKKLEADLADAGIDNNAVLDDIYEQLDAPAIAADTIEELVEKVDKLSKESLGVIVAHHNLLPQTNPRVDPYTELINSGSLRTTIGQLGRPILFLHGHIHTDPVEIVTNPIQGRRPLICISAPAFADGFNLLEIAFDAASKPIGCKIIPYRTNDGGYVTKMRHIIVPFGGIPSRILDAQSSTLASVVLHRQILTWVDFIQQSEVASLGLLEHKVQTLTVELYWHGMIDIENVEEPAANWRLRSLMG